MSEMIILTAPDPTPSEASIYSADVDGDADGDAGTSQTLSAVPEDILIRLKSMDREQRSLREEVNELNTKLAEETENSKGLEKRIEEMVAAFNTEQLRMPARLHNATCNKSPHGIKAPPISPGKTPKNFPSTRGEFEHLTRERYEGILNEYGVKHSGDVHEKRETLRAFLGIPVDMVKK